MSIEVNPKAIVATLDATLAERDKLKADNAELRAALVMCEKALAILPEDCLGRDPQEGWPYRDELLHNVRAALAATEGEE